MTITTAQFVIDYPEFSNQDVFPTSWIQQFLNMAYVMLDACVWSSMQDTGVELFTAHKLVLRARDTKAVGCDGIPGLATSGIPASKTVGSVSAGYDVSASQIEGWGPYNLTTYGREFAYLARMAGMAVIQLGTCPSEPIQVGEFP